MSTITFYRAKIIENAPIGNIIFAQLYGSDGVLITEPIEVYCDIFGETGDGNLNAALPLLESDTEIEVSKHGVLIGEELVQRYFCTGLFWHAKFPET